MWELDDGDYTNNRRKEDDEYGYEEPWEDEGPEYDTGGFKQRKEMVMEDVLQSNTLYGVKAKYKTVHQKAYDKFLIKLTEYASVEDQGKRNYMNDCKAKIQNIHDLEYYNIDLLVCAVKFDMKNPTNFKGLVDYYRKFPFAKRSQINVEGSIKDARESFDVLTVYKYICKIRKLNKM